jgi:hypothetical protein
LDVFYRIVDGLQKLCLVGIGIAFLVCLPAIFIRQMRGVASVVLYLCLTLWSLSLFLWCVANIYIGWGAFWLTVGLLLGGVGVVPVAFFCFLFGRQWSLEFDLLCQVAVIAGGYFTFSWMVKRSEAS